MAWISEAFDRAHDLSIEQLQRVGRAIREINEHIAAQRLASAGSQLEVTWQDAEELAPQWNAFLEAVGKGAGRAVVALEITRDASFSIATSLATGGATSALGVTSALPKVVLAASIDGVGDMAKAGEILAGTPREFEVIEAVAEGVKTAAVETIVGVVTESIGPLVIPAPVWSAGRQPLALSRLRGRGMGRLPHSASHDAGSGEPGKGDHGDID